MLAETTRGKTVPSGWRERLISSLKLYPVLMVLIFLAYAAGRVVTSLPSLDKPRVLADTGAYSKVSAQPLDDIRFWAGSRVVGFPLLLKIANRDENLTARVQLGLSILAWGLLAWMVSRFFRFRWLSLLAFTLILLFSLDRHITGWDSVMMSESLSLTSLAVFLAAALWLLDSWHPLRAAVFLVSALLLAFTRDTNAWMLVFLAVLLLVGVVLRWLKPRTSILSAALVLIFLLSNTSANIGLRWVFPLENLVGQRVLPDPSALPYFEACGMPLSPALLEFSGGRFANSDDRAMMVDPELAPFRNWVVTTGKSCYMRWLVTHPLYTGRDALSQFDFLISFPTVDRYFSRKFDPLMPVAVGKLLYPEGTALWVWIYVTIAALVVLWKAPWRDNPLWAAFLCLGLLVFPHLYLTWHGDAMAPDRHALSVGAQLYLAFWLLNLLIADSLWRVQAKRAAVAIAMQ